MIFPILAFLLFTSFFPTFNDEDKDIVLVVLGIAQDAGYPQAGCSKSCCKLYWHGQTEKKLVTSLGIVDNQQNKTYMIDATPDFREQWEMLRAIASQTREAPDGIFLTHAHIGHYTGLMALGREVMGTKHVLTYAMPRMKSFLETNGPWEQLVTLGNIKLREIAHETPIPLSKNLEITPFKVPHRDEYSETVGFSIQGPNKKVLFIPDINKWSIWKKSLKTQVKRHDLVFVDGTFFDNGELPGRDMSLIPHPFVSETISQLKGIPEAEKKKVHFIHFNHTNPLLTDSSVRAVVEKQGFKIAEEGMQVVL